MEVWKDGLLAPLKGRIVTGLARVAVVMADEEEVLVDRASVVFTLEDGRRWELLSAVESDLGVLLFKQLGSDDDLVFDGGTCQEEDEEQCVHDDFPPKL